MKEVLFLPTNTEVLFPPLLKQSEKRPFPEEGMSFRDYLEQAKSAPEKSPAKGIDRRSNQVQKSEPLSPPPSAEATPKVDLEEDGSSKIGSEEQASVPAVIPPETGNAAPVLSDPIATPAVVETGISPSLELQGMDNLVEIGGSTLESATSLLILNSLSVQPQATELSQNSAADKAFDELLQTQNEPAASPEAAEKSDQAASQAKANVDLDQSDAISRSNSRQSAEGSKETGKATVFQTAEAVSKKSPEAPATIAQDQARFQSGVAEVSPVKREEAQSPSAKEGLKPEVQSPSAKQGAKPEAAQASGPPLNPAAAKSIEPARLAEAHRPEIVQQVARELEVFGKSGQTSLRIQLYPEHLGRIDVRLVSKADGVQIVLRADNASTAFLLERDLNTLRESLVQAGVNLSGLSVGHGQAQNRSDLGQGELPSPNQHAERFGNIVKSEEPSARSSEHRWRDSSSTVDYRI